MNEAANPGGHESGEDSGRRKARLFLVLFVVVIALVVMGAFLLLQRRTQFQALAKKPKRWRFPRWR